MAKKKKEVDQESKLWKDIVSLLKEVTPFRPAPVIDPDTKLAGDLRLSTKMRSALKANWNEMIRHYKTQRPQLKNLEAEELETAGAVWFRIAKEDKA